jgi:ComF family protein
MNNIVRILNKLLDILFPIECLICEKEGFDLCQNCLEKLQPPKKQNFPWIVSLGNYHDKNMEHIMRHIKRQPNERAASILAKAFSDMIMNRPVDPSSWIIIPIPIYKNRFRERGYNQSELLAKPIATLFGFPVSIKTLVKIKQTKKQGTSKSKEERAQNISGSFAVKNNKHIINKNVILIDDIATTGSTLSEARKTLLAAGARRVMAWTVAN